MFAILLFLILDCWCWCCSPHARCKEANRSFFQHICSFSWWCAIKWNCILTLLPENNSIASFLLFFLQCELAMVHQFCYKKLNFQVIPFVRTNWNSIIKLIWPAKVSNCHFRFLFHFCSRIERTVLGIQNKSQRICIIFLKLHHSDEVVIIIVVIE